MNRENPTQPLSRELETNKRIGAEQKGKGGNI